jgi:hypothetical protein
MFKSVIEDFKKEDYGALHAGHCLLSQAYLICVTFRTCLRSRPQAICRHVSDVFIFYTNCNGRVETLNPLRY